jgi:hypothetical protein
VLWRRVAVDVSGLCRAAGSITVMRITLAKSGFLRSETSQKQTCSREFGCPLFLRKRTSDGSDQDVRLNSVRVGLRYRALAVQMDDGYLWFWIGSHANYDRLVGNH